MNVIENGLKTKATLTHLRDDGIMVVETSTTEHFSLDDAKEAIVSQAVVSKGQKRPLLVFLRDIKFMSREARAYIGGPEAEKNVSASALVINSTVGRVLGNFMIGFNKTLYPTKLFTDEDDAIEWLKGYLK